MFEDSRSKNILIVAHCVLNQNAVSDGTAEYPGALEEIVNMAVRNGVGVVQMPCPELSCLGLDRGNIRGGQSPVVRENTRIRAMMKEEPAASRMKELVRQVADQIREYRKHHFNILGIVGINRSPSCGVDTTSKNNREVKGSGVFMDALEMELKEMDLSISFMGIKPSVIGKGLALLEKTFKKRGENQEESNDGKG